MAEGNGYASRDELDAPFKRRFEDVWLPVKGVKVRIRSLNELEYSGYQAKLMQQTQGKNPTAALARARRMQVIQHLVDGNGERLYQDAEIDRLRTWDAADISAVQEGVSNITNVDKDDLEALVKNSSGTTDADSQ